MTFMYTMIDIIFFSKFTRVNLHPSTHASDVKTRLVYATRFHAPQLMSSRHIQSCFFVNMQSSHFSPSNWPLSISLEEMQIPNSFSSSHEYNRMLCRYEIEINLWWEFGEGKLLRKAKSLKRLTTTVNM